MYLFLESAADFAETVENEEHRKRQSTMRLESLLKDLHTFEV